MKIYEIDFAINEAIANYTNPETGELTEEGIVALEALDMERDKKLDNMICAYKNQKAEINAIEAEIKALKKRKESLENNNERFRKFIYKCLSGKPFSSARNKVTFSAGRESTAVDESICPKKYMNIKYVADKELIKQLLKSGKKIKGCSLVTGEPTMKIS